ncbi:MarR family transcriptional regulator [Oerskovia turbata]|uniref:MarR family transcriptional regulator n=1 Tax=Oerskovia turbata TaxID=1713 RepID=A0A4Q1KUL9_9CELL|nr:MarR family winged helix-turn-helix transcriptional regulator [Oerskovia turbata]RXR25869.1 MarR family transcriptional regulator [Oerskovia turbata]RXR33435.1 MarR family transcriptional regulator [Oerskovia turbata]TGJ96115.1 MarR family transcriptional regulator [Actinotalea fermentans ATCC 43279 = JCM 9966 = DSM 3133]
MTDAPHPGAGPGDGSAPGDRPVPTRAAPSGDGLARADTPSGATMTGDPRVPGYRSDLLDSLVRVMGLWTSGDFLAAVAAREGIDLDTPAIVVLTVVWRQGPRRPSAIAEHLSTGPSNVSKILRRLDAAGLTERREDPDDARASRVHLTEAGARVARTFVAAGDALVDELLDGWSAQDRLVFSELMRRFEGASEAFLDRG